MYHSIFTMFETLESIFWMYGGIPILLGLGGYLSCKSKWFQIFQLSRVFSIFKEFLFEKPHGEQRGVSPIYAFFASVGGCIGIGNVIGVCTAVQVGGPGAVFWIWVAGLLGMLVKYGEIYLNFKAYPLHDISLNFLNKIPQLLSFHNKCTFLVE